jgi:hypothetical protein
VETRRSRALAFLNEMVGSSPRRSKLELDEWAKHLMRYKDGRFATHPRFRFFTLNLIFRHRAMSHGKFLFTRDVGHRSMTVGQLKSRLLGSSGTQLASKIIRCVKSVRGTRAYWALEGAKLRNMICQIGTSSFFYTLYMADMSWPDLHKLMPEDPFRSDLSPNESYRIRLRNVSNNPHIVSSYLSTRHRVLRETILQHLGLTDDCAVEDFWYRIEWQARGSGTKLHVSPFFPSANRFPGHIHWIKNAVRMNDIDWNDPLEVGITFPSFSLPSTLTRIARVLRTTVFWLIVFLLKNVVKRVEHKHPEPTQVVSDTKDGYSTPYL